jgi:hypothetical protein
MTTVAAENVQDYIDTYSDLYKEAFGMRPRNWNGTLTIEQWREEFATLRAICEENARLEKQSEEKAIVELKATIASLIERGAKDEATALQWLHDAHDTNGDSEYLCYQLGLPYGYFK